MAPLLEGVHWRRDVDGTAISPWVPSIRAGIDNGYFGPGSAVWAVHGSLPTFIAGIRALLIQTLHPGAMAGVADHSRYREDTMGRLNGTIRWIATTTFGDRAMAEASASAVAQLHRKVTGTYTASDGAEQPYGANDPHLMHWVHDAFTEAFLGAHLIWGGPIPGGSDAYVAEWARSGELMGVIDPPRTADELREEMHGFVTELASSDRVADAVRFIRRPNLPAGLRAVYPVLFAGAVASLPEHYRQMLGLRRPPWPAITTCRVLLKIFGLVLGPTSPSERAAKERAARLRASSS